MPCIASTNITFWLTINLCPLQGTGGHEFDPGPRHTKVVNNGTSCSSLGTQIYGVELGLVDPVSDNVTGCGFMSSVWGMILQ